jgi:sporulation protein YlmC with PRC-barrel domain
MLKRTLTAAALATVLAAPAFAQTNPPSTPMKPGAESSTQSPGFVQNQDATDWRSSKLVGASVYGPDNASIGEVNDVLIGNNGNVRAVVIGVGGFLGVGEKNVAIPMDALHITRKANSSSIDKINVSFTKDQLKSAPQFAYYEPEKSQTTGSGLNSLTPKTKSSTAPDSSSK